MELIAGAAMVMDAVGRKVNDMGAAGVIARPPLLFLAALLFGFGSDRFLEWPPAVAGKGVSP
jgi:hypothetical protein